MSYPYVSQIETGDRDPSLRTMHKLAEALEMGRARYPAVLAS